MQCPLRFQILLTTNAQQRILQDPEDEVRVERVLMKLHVVFSISELIADTFARNKRMQRTLSAGT